MGVPHADRGNDLCGIVDFVNFHQGITNTWICVDSNGNELNHLPDFNGHLFIFVHFLNRSQAIDRIKIFENNRVPSVLISIKFIIQNYKFVSLIW